MIDAAPGARGRPIRFLGAVTVGWVGLRTAMLWPGGSAASLLPTLAPIPGAVAQAAMRAPDRPPVAANASRWIPAAVQPPPALRSSASPARDAAPAVESIRIPLAIGGASPAPILPGLPNIAVPMPGRALPSRWSGSAWLAVRGGTGLAAGALGGQLGGSQAGVRIAYLLDRRHRIALAARVASPLGSGLREAALGVEWQPTRLPVRLVAEQRVALGPGTGGPAIGIVGGIDPTPLPLGFRLDGYGQAGVIRRSDTEPYVDGALHAVRRLASLGGIRFDLGAGLWGAVQRGAARLDLGPSLGASVPLGKQRVRIALDWRERVAGDAHPGSGPALTLGADF